MDGLNNNPQNANFDFLAQYGLTGLRQYSGWVFEDFLPELQGKNGIAVYKEMSDNDAVIGGVLFGLEMLIRSVGFSVQPASENKADVDCAEFVKSCMHDMQTSWNDILSEIMSFFAFGWSYHEINYKRRLGKSPGEGNEMFRSKYDDGLIGWRDLPVRSQDSLYRWIYDETHTDKLVAMSQMPPPNFDVRTIPLEKALHFVVRSRKRNPEGRSILRNAYQAFWYKRRLQEIEAIGVERNIAGFPVLTGPEGMDFSDKNDTKAQDALAYAQQLVSNIRVDKKTGAVVPGGWELKLISAGTGSNIALGLSKVIGRYDRDMALSVLEDFMLLGHGQVGSYSLADSKARMFHAAIDAYLETICGVFNTQAIPRLIDLNEGKFGNISDYPKMVHGDTKDVNLKDFADYIRHLTAAGWLTPSEEDEDWARRIADMPEKTIEG